MHSLFPFSPPVFLFLFLFFACWMSNRSKEPAERQQKEKGKEWQIVKRDATRRENTEESTTASAYKDTRKEMQVDESART